MADMTGVQLMKTRLRDILSDRAAGGARPQGDIQVLRPEFIDYSEDGWLTVEFIPQDWQKNGIGVVQGGILGYMLDCVIGPLAFVISDGRLAGTISMTTSYLRPVKADGEGVRVRARAISDSKRMMHIEAYIYNHEGKVAATAAADLMKK